MNAEIDALLRAVLAAPKDDSPRLVAGDWFREHGHEELADFIAWQVARPDCWTFWNDDPEGPWPAWAEKNKEEIPKPLLDWWMGHASEVGKKHPRWGWEWRRGFVHQLGTFDAPSVFRGPTSTEWLDEHAQLLALHPIRKVILSSRLGWCGNGGPGNRPSLFGAERVAERGPWNSGRRRYECVRATTPHPPEAGGPEHGEDALRDVIAREWPGVEIDMPPEPAFVQYNSTWTPPSTEERKAMRAQMEEYQNSLQRYMRLYGSMEILQPSNIVHGTV